MKFPVTYLFVVAILTSCGNNNKTDVVVKKDTVAAQQDSLRVNPPANQDTLRNYDSSVYEGYLTPQLITFFNKKVGTWKIPAPANWEAYWFNQCKTDSSLVNFVSGDYNCDEKPDYAVILQTGKTSIDAYAILSTADGFKSEKIEHLGTINDVPIGNGLETLAPGKIEHLTDGGDIPPPVNVKCASIQLTWFEKAARTYYWEKGVGKTLQTGD